MLTDKSCCSIACQIVTCSFLTELFQTLIFNDTAVVYGILFSRNAGWWRKDRVDTAFDSFDVTADASSDQSWVMTSLKKSDTSKKKRHIERNDQRMFPLQEKKHHFPISCLELELPVFESSSANEWTWWLITMICNNIISGKIVNIFKV